MPEGRQPGLGGSARPSTESSSEHVHRVLADGAGVVAVFVAQAREILVTESNVQPVKCPVTV